jgi:putative transport protein
MSWLFDLHETQRIAHAVGVLAFVCVVGMSLGSLKFRGIGLGTAGVLFAGILAGHLRLSARAPPRSPARSFDRFQMA